MKSSDRSKTHASKNSRRTLNKFFFLGGVILPVLAMLFETTTHFCAQHFFDPFPSIGHVLMFSVIPLSNFFVWMSERRDLSGHYGVLTLASGMSAGIGLMYALMFFPILGLCLLFALCGIGLLGLAPLLSIYFSMQGGKAVCKLASAKGTYFDAHQVKHIGHLLILVMVVSVELPSTLTRMNLSEAANNSIQSIDWLRQYGNQEVMLRACYERSGRATDIVGSLYECGHPLSIDKARAVFYKVTGKPFNFVPIPASARATIQHAGLAKDVAGVNNSVEDEFDLDADIAGEVVSGVARGLVVHKMTIRGDARPNMLFTEYNWEIEFENLSRYEREARFKTLLPPGSVLNAASITINGQEREAKILARSDARTVYVKSVAARKKNPLLISSCGPDELLVQCFPVSPGDQLLRLKMNVISPMVLRDDKNAVAGFPVIIEKNFKLDVPIKVKVSDAVGVLMDNAISPEQYSSMAGCVGSKGFGYEDDYWFPDYYGDDPEQLVLHSIRPEKVLAPRKLIVIVDGSVGMAKSIKQIVDGLKHLPEGVSVDIYFQSDLLKQFGTNLHAKETGFENELKKLESAKFIGGQDDTSAVLSAIQKAAPVPGTSVFWINGPQPLNSADKNQFKKSLLTRENLLFDFVTEAAPNELFEGMQSLKGLKRLARRAEISFDLQTFFSTWTVVPDISPAFVMVPRVNWREKDEFLEPDPPLAQLYGSFQIEQLVKEGLLDGKASSDPSALEKAKKIALQYHIVTPVSSAVVADDDPNEEKKVATGVAPEADTWILLIVAGTLICVMLRSRRRELRTVP